MFLSNISSKDLIFQHYEKLDDLKLWLSPLLLSKYYISAVSRLTEVLDNRTIPVRLLNPNPKPVTVYKNSKLGFLHPTAETI